MTNQPVTALDVSTGRQITGKFVRRYNEGITIDDDRDVRYYVTFARIISGYNPTPQLTTPGINSPIW